MGGNQPFYVDWEGNWTFSTTTEQAMNEPLVTRLPSAVANANATLAANTQIMAAGSDIFSDTKAMLIGLGVFLGVFLIIVGSFFTIPKLREGVGEAIMHQVGVIVLGVLVSLSVGIAAALASYAGDKHIVDPKYVHENEWGS